MARRRMKRVYYREGWWKRFRKSKNFRWAVLGAGLVAAALLVLFVVLPLAGVELKKSEPPLSEKPFEDPLAGEAGEEKENDISGFQQEALIEYRTINDPYMSGNEIVFSSSSVVGGVAVYDKLVLFDVIEKKHTQIPVRVKYENIVWTKLNEDFIVWVDSNGKGGGRVMMYDRAEGKSHLIKEYAFALPQISLHGDYVAFLQQAGKSLDRLYLYDLRKREAVCVRVLENMPSMAGGVHMSEDGITYAVPYMEDDIQKCRIYVQPVDGSAGSVLEPDRYAYAPKKSGIYTAFLSSTSGPPKDIYLMKGGETPILVESDVTNFDMGRDFLAYTKDNNIYVYRFSSGQKYRLNSQVSRGRLASVNGNTVVWYDVTGGSADVDIVKYAKVVL
ncbi:MAG: hypothetical protein IJP03_04285 [Christensenellaceae bacterium]|nr:hypothetical protein [Christensenellaceae bacterium]